LQSQDPRGFNALYQGRPSADTGSFFNEKDLLVYGSFSDLPKNLRYYVASDHALGLTQEHDKTCCIPIGVDEEGTAWVHPDIFWDRQDTHTTVQRMIRMIKSFKPLFWWAENGHITKSIGPFLRREMVEQQAVCALIEMTPIHDKLQRAQSIHGRISLGRVRFPAFAQWWPDAKRQILQFPYGANDDFVDAMSLLGLGLQQQIRAAPPPKEEAKGPAIGTVGWVKWQAEKENRFLNQHRNTAGW
jgi:predicted phage terminase large subunit-like protein